MKKQIVLAGNLLGMIPYSFTFTSHIIVTFAMAIFVVVTVTIIGILLAASTGIIGASVVLLDLDPGEAERFAAELGPLKSYVDERRMDAAALLVRETGAYFHKIAELVAPHVDRAFRSRQVAQWIIDRNASSGDIATSSTRISWAYGRTSCGLPRLIPASVPTTTTPPSRWMSANAERMIGTAAIHANRKLCDILKVF